jgi:UTP-glucose-1-phosphate uridylyltransferase/mevalonate kinase
MKLFVPGRICLFGEHSDWAGSYRRINGEIEKGFTLIAGTNQGLYAEVKPHPSKLIFHSTLDDGTRNSPYEVAMEHGALLEEAEKGDFYSYVAGTAYQILTNYRVRGLVIDNYHTDLPIQKGLSSSAALCVLVARAFNRMYDLKMTVRGEMELAYLGEITTPSRCGRMDQGCAYGNRPILMSFDGDKIDVTEMNVPSDLYFVIVDLCAEKDTKEILNQLNHCYPFAEDELQRDVQSYLGPINARIVHEAVEALKDGNAEKIGLLMKQAQEKFDKNLQPACPSQLTAPVLHKILSHKDLQPYILGGKGVGSQGDGTAQFIVKDEQSQEKVVEILNRDLSMPCLKLTLSPSQRVRKAVIPAAGFGTRLFPASKAIKKELFPVIDSNGMAKPVIMMIVEEAINAGIEEVCIIIQKADYELFESFFCSPPTIENYNKLSNEDKKMSDYILEIGHHINFVTQNIQDGFGHAVYCARDWIKNEPFILMLGDHLYASHTDISCTRQLLDVYEKADESVVGLKVTSGAELHSAGCVTGIWKEQDTVLSIHEFSEKPNLEYARNHLFVDGMISDHFLTVFGTYVLKPSIFDYLEDQITHNIREKGEFQLTSCLDRLCREEGVTGYVINGRTFDIGSPEVYRKTIDDFKDA